MIYRLRLIRGGRGVDQTMLATLRDAVLGDFRPDLTLYLDVTPEVGLKRARARGELDVLSRSPSTSLTVLVRVIWNLQLRMPASALSMPRNRLSVSWLIFDKL